VSVWRTQESLVELFSEIVLIMSASVPSGSAGVGKASLYSQEILQQS
jgi:hypothetical protein